jgi:hypothetical protein
MRFGAFVLAVCFALSHARIGRTLQSMSLERHPASKNTIGRFVLDKPLPPDRAQWRNGPDPAMCRSMGLLPREGRVRVVDVSLFSWEVELLSAKLRELHDLVDGFVVVESNLTFQGEAKALVFRDVVLGGLEGWGGRKVIGGEFSREPCDRGLGKEAMYRCIAFYEFGSRRYGVELAMSAFGLSDEDLLIIADVDELPSRAAVWATKFCEVPDPRYHELNFFTLGWHYHSLKWRGIEDLPNLAVMAAGLARREPELSMAVRVATYAGLDVVDRSSVREILEPLRHGARFQGISLGGWHMSNFMSASGISRKIQSFAHLEYNQQAYRNTRRLQACIDGGFDYLGREGQQLLPAQDAAREMAKSGLAQRWYAPASIPLLFEEYPEVFGARRGWLDDGETSRRMEHWEGCFGALRDLGLLP